MSVRFAGVDAAAFAAAITAVGGGRGGRGSGEPCSAPVLGVSARAWRRRSHARRVARANACGSPRRAPRSPAHPTHADEQSLRHPARRHNRTRHATRDARTRKGTGARRAGLSVRYQIGVAGSAPRATSRRRRNLRLDLPVSIAAERGARGALPATPRATAAAQSATATRLNQPWSRGGSPPASSCPPRTSSIRSVAASSSHPARPLSSAPCRWRPRAPTRAARRSWA